MKTLIFLITLSFFIRILFILDNKISFHYDMARDAYQARSIWKDHDFKIQGPPTTTPGLYSGVLYYYLLAIPYTIGNGDPKFVAFFLAFINSLAIIPIFLLSKNIFKSNKWAILASFLYATSFEAIQYGPWLSNPGPAMFTIAMFFYYLRLWQTGYRWGLPLAVTFAALSAQLEFFLIFLFVVILFFKFLFKIKVTLQNFLLSALFAATILGTYFLSIIKFNTFSQTIYGLLTISQNTEINFRIKFTDLLLNFINRFSDLYINNFFPVNVFIGGLLGFIVLFILLSKSFAKDKQNLDKSSYRFILFCLLSYLPIFIFGGQNATYTTVGLITPAILGVVIFLQIISQINKKLVLTLIIIIILSNLYMSLKISPQGQVILVIPKDMLLKNQLALIDKTYQEANGNQFSINTLTLPLWTNTTWAYLYSWYGLQKYGYTPSFYGRDQVGLLGADDLKKIEKSLPLSFFIIEPHVGIPANFYNDEISSENAKTKLVESFKFDGLTLEKREPKQSE